MAEGKSLVVLSRVHVNATARHHIEAAAIVGAAVLIAALVGVALRSADLLAAASPANAILLGLLFWGQANLWGAWAGHFAWNMALALAGLPVSGIGLADDTLGGAIHGAVPGLLTGGAFGPEASLGCTGGLLAVITVQVWRLQRSGPTAAAQPANDYRLEASSDSVTNL